MFRESCFVIVLFCTLLFGQPQLPWLSNFSEDDFETAFLGLTPFQALEAATTNPADFFELTDGSGTVA